MRPRLICLFLLSLMFAVKASAQQQQPVTCGGSLGDPVVKEDFGSGGNPGPSVGSETNMIYTPDPCPEDGLYTIVNNVNANQSCHDTWQVVPHDHTGNPNGYMMLINASFAPSVFFTKQLTSLCPNTKYEFSAYVMNLITQATQTSDPRNIKPNITFSILDENGNDLQTPLNTGDIEASTSSSDWHKYALLFKTPANFSGFLTLKMTNNAPGGNGNDLLLDDIAFRPCGPTITYSFSNTGSTEPPPFCQGDHVHFTISATPQSNDIPDPAYQWQVYTANGWVDISGATSQIYTVDIPNAATGSYQYRIGICAAENIGTPACRTYSDPATVTVNALPTPTPLSPNTAVCETRTLTLTADGGATYSWSGPGFTGNTNNPLVIDNVTTANAGQYSVVVTSANGCSAAPLTTNVTVLPQVVASVQGTTTICAGTSTPISASGGTTYRWTPSTGLDHDDIANPIATPLVTTTYNVTVSNGGCYDDTKSVTITVNQLPTADAGKDKVIFEGQSTTLNGVSGGDNLTNVYWTPTDFLDNPNSLTPVATPTDDITYTLHVESASCGSATDEVFVRVYKKITIPNTFSPNGDGVNDLWNIDALITYPQCSVKVFNRYGQQVYYSTGYALAWDGTANGQRLPDGAYYYIIDLKNGTALRTGWVAIVR